jgi:glycosyltransferase involved in cell wall biosynthesis
MGSDSLLDVDLVAIWLNLKANFRCLSSEFKVVVYSDIVEGSGAANMKLLVAIPALNEQDTIATVINDVQEHLPFAEILVINDGSSDRTRSIVESMGVPILNFAFNLGVGAAMRAAFKFAVEEGFTHVLQFDGDGQHNAAEAIQLISKGVDVDIVIGAREFGVNGYRVGKVRRLGMIILSNLLSLRLRQRLHDVTSGFRLTGVRALRFFSVTYPPEYLGDTVESLLAAGLSGFKVREVRVEMKNRQGGKPSQNYYALFAYLMRVFTVILVSSISLRKAKKSS